MRLFVPFFRGSEPGNDTLRYIYNIQTMIED